MSQIIQYPNTNFYSGIPGKPFIIKTQFASVDGLLDDLNKGWTSPIAISDYIVISEGLQSYKYPNTIEEKYEFECFCLGEEENKDNIKFSGTLWQKISKNKNWGTKGIPCLNLDGPNNTYFVSDNNVGYQLIADLNAIPSFKATTKTLNPGELPKVENKGTNTSIDLEFSIPRAANFHWLDSIKGEDGKNLMLINADGSLKDDLKINNTQAKAKIQIDDFVIHRPTGIMYRCYKIEQKTYLKLLSNISIQTQANVNLQPTFIKNENGQLELNQPTVDLNWGEVVDEEGYEYNPLYTFNLPKMPKLKMYAYPTSVNAKVTASESYPDSNDQTGNTLAFNLQIPLEEIDALRISYYAYSLDTLPQLEEKDSGALGLIYSENGDEKKIELAIFLISEDIPKGQWEIIGELTTSNLTKYGEIIGLASEKDPRNTYSTKWIEKHFSWKDARQKDQDETSSAGMIDFLTAPNYNAELISNEHDILFTTEDQHLYIALNKDTADGGYSLEKYAVVSPVNDNIDDTKSKLPIGSSLIRQLSNRCFELKVLANDWKPNLEQNGTMVAEYTFLDQNEYFSSLMTAPMITVAYEEFLLGDGTITNSRQYYSLIKNVAFREETINEEHRVTISLTTFGANYPVRDITLYIWRLGENSISLQDLMVKGDNE